jgi:hypothetical protein
MMEVKNGCLPSGVVAGIAAISPRESGDEALQACRNAHQGLFNTRSHAADEPNGPPPMIATAAMLISSWS